MLRCEQAEVVPIWDFINNPALDKDVFIKEIFIFDGELAAILSIELGLDAAIYACEWI